MKTTNSNSGKPKLATLAVFFLLIFGLFSCEYYGRDGRPGKAYLALDWSQSEPYYIEAGHKYIPNTFYWGEFYRVPSGIYLFYYEGEYYNGRRWIDYAWEVEYEIWENPGEFGLPNGIDGYDGADAYFTIVCYPSGPKVFVEEFYKSASSDELIETDFTENSGEIVEITQTKENFTLKIKYRKVKPKYIPGR